VTALLVASALVIVGCIAVLTVLVHCCRWGLGKLMNRMTI
jgi:hypothetical protein